MYLLTERTYLRAPSMSLSMVCSISNKFDRNAFDNALKKLYYIHPLISSTIKYNNTNYYYSLNELNKINYTIINPPYNVDNSIVNNFIKNQISIPFDFKNEGLLRVFVFENENDFTVLFFAHHLLCDGISLEILTKNFLDLYNGDNINKIKNTQLIKTMSDFKNNCKLPFGAKIYTEFLNTYWKISNKKFTEDDYLRMSSNYHKKHIPEITTLTLNENETNNLINNCKKYKITVNSAICSALLYSIENSNKKYKICTSINVRNELCFDVSEYLGNFASAITIDYKYNSNKDFWENTALIHNLLKEKINDINSRYLCLNLYLNLDPNLIDSSYFYAYDNFHNMASKKVFNMFNHQNQITITNLGKLNISSQYKNFKVKDILFIPPTYNNKIIGVSTFDNKLSLTLTSQKNNIDKNNLSSNILSKIKSLLCN